MYRILKELIKMLFQMNFFIFLLHTLREFFSFSLYFKNFVQYDLIIFTLLNSFQIYSPCNTHIYILLF